MTKSAPLRRKRVWNVSDFSEHAGVSHRQARRLLKKLDAKHRGRLLIPSAGANREYTFYPAVLSRLEPDLFSPIQSLEYRLEELEDDVSGVKADTKRIASQVGQNTRQIAQLSLFKKAS